MLFFPDVYKKIENVNGNDELTMLMEIPRSKVKHKDYQFRYRVTTDNPFKVLLNCFHIYDYEENEGKYEFHMFWGAMKVEK